MADETIGMVTDSINAFVHQDIELAHKVVARDDIVDDIFCVIKKDLIDIVCTEGGNGEQAFDLLQIAKYYERIGDHAVNIAEWVIFSITGVHKDRQVI
jgi:phosphate transport system protein